MGKKSKRKKLPDERESLYLPDDFPPLPPPPPPGGWMGDPVAAVVKDINAPPPGGYYPPMPEDPIDFRRLEIKVGKITFAMKHPHDPESLMLTYVKIGEEFQRPVVSDLAKFYSEDELLGRKVVAMMNLEPPEKKNNGNRTLLMCAATGLEGEGEKRYELWDPPEGAKIGDDVRAEGYLMEPQFDFPELPFMHNEEKLWEQIYPDIRVNSTGEVVYKENHRLFVRGRDGFITTASMRDCGIKNELYT